MSEPVNQNIKNNTLRNINYLTDNNMNTDNIDFRVCSDRKIREKFTIENKDMLPVFS